MIDLLRRPGFLKRHRSSSRTYSQIKWVVWVLFSVDIGSTRTLNSSVVHLNELDWHYDGYYVVFVKHPCRCKAMGDCCESQEVDERSRGEEDTQVEFN